MDGAMPRAHQLKEGETVIGRAPTCDLVITAPLMSRHHAVVRVDSKRVFLKDAGSTYGTTFKGAKLTAEQEIKPGDSFTLGPITLTLDREIHENEVLSEKHQIFDESATIVKRMENLNLPPAAATVEAVASAAPSVAAPSPTPPAAPTVTPAQGIPQTMSAPAPVAAPTAPMPSKLVMTPSSERRSGLDRRKADVGRPAGERRSGRDRRGGRLLRLLSEISKTLVTMQPLEKVLARVVELVFEIVPAERAFLLLRDSIDQPLSARVMRNRDGSVPAKVSISRTIVNTVMRDRVAMLAKDALYDTRLHASDSIQSMNVRSFMCAPLWNQNDVMGVLYCDNDNDAGAEMAIVLTGAAVFCLALAWQGWRSLARTAGLDDHSDDGDDQGQMNQPPYRVKCNKPRAQHTARITAKVRNIRISLPRGSPL
jgi:pSer/pThr/pTyr-binding forkhead associated (FHA) protein